MRRGLPSGLLAVFVAGFVLCSDGIAVAAQDAAPLHVARGRIVGVYDDATGRPIAGVQVTDLQNGLSTESTETGTLSLFFVDTSGSMLRFRKLGYATLLMAATNSPSDSIPLTVLLHPLGVQLKPVVTKAHNNMRGPADTVRRLDLIGFYDRRATSAAPASAFVTSEKIEGLRLLSDVKALTGRAICSGNLFVDGVRMNLSAAPAKGVRNLRASTLDQWIDPSAVLAVEMYRFGDVPIEYVSRDPCGATLIWTR